MAVEKEDGHVKLWLPIDTTAVYLFLMAATLNPEVAVLAAGMSVIMTLLIILEIKG